MLKSVQTIQQIAKGFDIHPIQVSEWKKAMTAGASGVFDPRQARAETVDFERQRDELPCGRLDFVVILPWANASSRRV